LLKFLRF